MITESHKAVGKMYIFTCHIWVIRSNIIMPEIPKSFYTELNKLINNFFGIIAWYTKHCNGRGVVATKIIQTVNMSYGYVTVSYTHLDVYKRQAVLRLNILKAKKSPVLQLLTTRNNKNTGEYFYSPVKDVYKRQD